MLQVICSDAAAQANGTLRTWIATLTGICILSRPMQRTPKGQAGGGGVESALLE
jgi:hypothetical protein